VVGPTRSHIYAIRCDVGGNGDGYYLDGNGHGLPFCAFDYYESTGQVIMKATTDISGNWYVKDLCL
jgi:hypothetical protein